MNKQQELFEKRQLMGATLQLAASALQNPIEDLSWEQVENLKKDIEASRLAVAGYIGEINQCIQDSSLEWREQWDLAFTVMDEFPKEYNPEDYNIDSLVEEFTNKGIDPKLANIVAHSLVNPEIS